MLPLPPLEFDEDPPPPPPPHAEIKKIDDIKVTFRSFFIVDDKFLKTIYCIEYICKLNRNLG